MSCVAPYTDAVGRSWGRFRARLAGGSCPANGPWARSCAPFRVIAVGVLVVLALSACGMEPVQRQPVSGDDGLHLSGRLDGRSVNVSHGEPDVTLGACEPDRPRAHELCIAAMGIDGDIVGLVVQNPDELVAGERIPVRGACVTDCEGVALVELRHDVDRILPTSGELVVREAGERFAATFTLRFPRGTLTGVFDVDPSFRR